MVLLLPGICGNHDIPPRDQLAYAHLIIRQAQSQGGLSWLDYDHSFRQQMATDPTMQWNILIPSLLASTTLGHQSSSSSPTFYTLCRAVVPSVGFLEPPTPPGVQQGPAMPSTGLDPGILDSRGSKCHTHNHTHLIVKSDLKCMGRVG
jgi:hypothetical protein